MAGESPTIKVALKGAKIAVISAQWHREICDALVSGATRAIMEAGAECTVDYVAGSFELPMAAQFALDGGADAAVVLGVVVRGETPHFDYVCQGVTNGIMNLTLELGKPIGFGVLTVDNIEQAIARSGVEGSKEDKGYDATVAALELLRMKNS